MTALNLPTPPAGIDVIGDARGNQVGIARERDAARRRGAEEDLILLEGGRLEHDGHAVRQRPLGDAGVAADRGLRDRPAGGLGVHERLAGRRVHVRLEPLAQGGLDDCRQRRAIRQHDAGRVRGGDEHEAVLVGEPVRRERVDLRQRHLGQEATVKRQLLPDRRQRFAAEEVAGVLVGAALGFTVGTFGRHPLVPEHHGLLRARQLRGREAELRDAVEFSHEGVQPARDAVARDERLQGRLVLHAGHREQGAVRRRPQERRVRALAQLVEPAAEHRAEELIEHQAAIAADRALIARGPQVADLDDSRGRFLVGHEGVPRAAAFRHVVGRPRARRRRVGQRREMLLDHRHDRVPIDVADDDHGHQVGAIPVAIEAHQLLALGALDDLGLADGRPIRVARAFELDAAHLVLRPLARAEVHPPFRQHDPALVIDAALVERGTLGPVLEHEQRAIQHPVHVGGHAQRVLGVVVARGRVGVGPDAQAERGEKIEDALARKVPRALELHVFDEVRQPLLVVVFEHRPGVHDEAQLGPARRLAVRAHVVAQAVGQRAERHLRIDRHLLRQRVRGHRFGRGLAPGGHGLRGLRGCRGRDGGKNRGQDAAEHGADARMTHTSILPEPHRRVERPTPLESGLCGRAAARPGVVSARVERAGNGSARGTQRPRGVSGVRALKTELNHSATTGKRYMPCSLPDRREI